MDVTEDEGWLGAVTSEPAGELDILGLDGDALTRIAARLLSSNSLYRKRKQARALGVVSDVASWSRTQIQGRQRETRPTEVGLRRLLQRHHRRRLEP